MNKRTALLISVAGVALIAFFLFARDIGVCPNYSYSDCSNFTDSMAEILTPVSALFLFSLLTHFMREEVFRAWVKFAIPWTALSMLLIFLAPQYGPGGFGPAISLDKGFVALIMSALSVLISTLIIIWKHCATKKA